MKDWFNKFEKTWAGQQAFRFARIGVFTFGAALAATTPATWGALVALIVASAETAFRAVFQAPTVK